MPLGYRVDGNLSRGWGADRRAWGQKSAKRFSLVEPNGTFHGHQSRTSRKSDDQSDRRFRCRFWLSFLVISSRTFDRQTCSAAFQLDGRLLPGHVGVDLVASSEEVGGWQTR